MSTKSMSFWDMLEERQSSKRGASQAYLPQGVNLIKLWKLIQPKYTI